LPNNRNLHEQLISRAKTLSEYLASPGSYQKSLSTSQVPAGTHYLALCLDGETIAETVIKQ